MTYHQQPMSWPSDPPPPPTRERGSWWKAGWFIGLVAALLGIIVGAAAAGSSPAKTKTRMVAGPTVVHTLEATVTSTPTVMKTIATRIRTRTVTYTPPPVDEFSDGTYRVGPDIPPGVYKTRGPSDGGSGIGCYYAILNSLNNQDIDSNDNFDGPTVVQLYSGKAFQVSGGCTWSRVG